VLDPKVKVRVSLSFAFGEPRHGWLPVKIAFEDFALEFDASYVPENAVQSLIDALFNAARNLPGQVIWDLEPELVVFDFLPVVSGIALTVSRARGYDKPTQAAGSIIGSKSEIVLPIWRALRRAQEANWPVEHWPAVDFVGLKGLGDEIR